MFITNSRQTYVYLSWLVVFAAALSLISPSISCRDADSVLTPATDVSVNAEPKGPADPNGLTGTEQRARSAALRAATRTATGGFSPSLEMKENVDFLLTPALLVQEAISEGVIITYPSE